MVLERISDKVCLRIEEETGEAIRFTWLSDANIERLIPQGRIHWIMPGGLMFI